MDELDDEERKLLKQLLQNLGAMGRVRRMFTTVLIWLSGIVSAGLIIWNATTWFKGNH